jgi:hypothetical protein
MPDPIHPNAHRPDRRRSPRIPYRTKAQFHNATTDGSGTTRNISGSGLFLVTPVPPDLGARIRIVFQLRNSKHPMNVNGDVVHSAPDGAGVQFIWS